jgi:hypothetical protein
MSDPDSHEIKEAPSAQAELDTTVVHMELTLIAIIQGVALTFLVERSYNLLVGFRILFWPYVLTGLLTILIFWSRSLIHTLTVIRWPLDIVHNIMYITCTLIEAVAFTQLTEPLYWYAWNALFAVTVWVLFMLDLRMIRGRIKAPSGPIGRNLYALVEREQLLGIKLFMPATVIFNVLAAVAITVWPAALIRRDGHVLIAMGQLTAAFSYLLYGIRFFSRVRPLIAGTRQEWRMDIS